MSDILLFISAIVGATGALPYIYAVLRGKAKPQLVSWLVWTILLLIMTISAFVAGQRASMILSLESLVSCGIVALIILRDPLKALIISIAVDVVAFVPTIIHGYKAPQEESLACFLCGAIAASLALVVAIGHHAGLTGLIYPVGATILNGFMSLLLVYGRVGLGTQYNPEYEYEETQ